MAAQCSCRAERHSPSPEARPPSHRKPMRLCRSISTTISKRTSSWQGAGGVRLMRQENPGRFTDVTALSKLPKSVTNASYTGAWAVDIEADGDLDIVLGSKEGVPTVLRNNGDGTFLAIHPFSGISGLSGFAWADFDGDGIPTPASSMARVIFTSS